MTRVRNTLVLLLVLVLAVSGVEAITINSKNIVPSTPNGENGFYVSVFNISATVSGTSASEAKLNFTLISEETGTEILAGNKILNSTFRKTIDKMEGYYTINILAWIPSNSSNTAQDTFGTVKVDRVEPKITTNLYDDNSIFNVTNATLNQNINLLADIEDMYLDSVVAGIYSEINDTQSTSAMNNDDDPDEWELSTTPSALGCTQEGNCNIAIRAEDEAGNVKIISQNLMIIEEVEQAEPEIITIIQPADGVEQKDSIVSLEFEVDTSNIEIPDDTVFCTYILKNILGAQQSFGNYFEDDFNVSGSTFFVRDEIKKVTDDLYTIELTCDDAEGNSYKQNASFPLFDVSRPNIMVEINSSNTSATVTLNGSEEFRLKYFKYKALGADDNTSVFINVEDDFKSYYEFSISDLLPDTFYVMKFAYEDEAENDGSTSENFQTLGGEEEEEEEISVFDVAAGTVAKETKDVLPGENYSHGISSIKKDQEVEIIVTNFDMNVREFIIAGKNDLRNIKLDVSASPQAPSWIKNPIPSTGEVFEYIQVLTENAPDTDLKYVKIRFEVNQNWMRNNELGAEDVALFRLVDDEWKQLPTTLLKEGALFNKYEALSPGFSLFSVAAERNTIESQENSSVLESQKNTDDPEPEVQENPDADSGKKLDLSFGIPWHWLIIGIVGILILVFLTYYMTISVSGDSEDMEEHTVVKAHMKRLETFVDEALSQGHSKAALRDKLIENGWDEKIVDFVLRRK